MQSGKHLKSTGSICRRQPLDAWSRGGEMQSQYTLLYLLNFIHGHLLT